MNVWTKRNCNLSNRNVPAWRSCYSLRYVAVQNTWRLRCFDQTCIPVLDLCLPQVCCVVIGLNINLFWNVRDVSRWPILWCCLVMNWHSSDVSLNLTNRAGLCQIYFNQGLGLWIIVNSPCQHNAALEQSSICHFLSTAARERAAFCKCQGLNISKGWQWRDKIKNSSDSSSVIPFFFFFARHKCHLSFYYIYNLWHDSLSVLADIRGDLTMLLVAHWANVACLRFLWDQFISNKHKHEEQNGWRTKLLPDK